ncbi:zinc finger protein draculin-like [Topomyia yanbarensis]|uniref:zinc finger protein draculin-like n=1 Tax=Topomyia yanbarensis TaxID=2498891 RepID=UPI00273CB5FE|nr:zinc finger protein draculin-like [Topomyia yanbarensis]
MESAIDIQNICRLCCKSKKRLNDIAVLEKDEKYPLKQIFTDTLRLEYNSEDGLPQSICKLCSTEVLRIHKTVEGYRANDVLLRNQLRSTVNNDIKPMLSIEILSQTEQDDPIIDQPDIKEEEPEYLENYSPASDAECFDNHNSALDTEYVENQNSGSETEDQDEWPPRDEINGSNVLAVSPKTLPKGSCILKSKSTIPENRIHPQKSRRHRRDSEHPYRPRLNDFKCYICKNESLESKQALLAHLHSHSDQLPYTCTICVMETIVIESVTTLNIHKRMHENPYKCDYCDRRYTDKRNIGLHVQYYHLGESAPCPSTCEQCGKVCPSKLSLKWHQVVHTKPLTCEQCGKVFTQKSKLRRHTQKRHGQAKQFLCHICNKILHSLDAVQLHIENLHSEKQLPCSFCPKKFSAKQMLRIHENKHKRDPSYKPPQSYKEHYTLLDGADEGWSQCKICGTKFKGKTIFPHMRTVHFAQQYRCETCEATFKCKESYDAHVLEHAFGKTFRCAICGKEFSTKKFLVTHLKTKKHRDHPLAKNLDWLTAQAKDFKHKVEGTLHDQGTEELDSAVAGLMQGSTK